MITPDLYKQILIKTDQLQPELKKIRRTLHQYPETGWMEMRTSSIIAGYLKKINFDEILTGEAVCKANARMGIPDKSCLSEHYTQTINQEGTDLTYLPDTQKGFTGVIGILRCGSGPVVALRFDIDALPIQESSEETHFPAKNGFSSQNNGVMHACGHDGHTAIGLGIARILSEIRHELHGTIKLIFQPAEEGVRGAQAIVENGHLDDVDYVLASHMYNHPQQQGFAIGVGKSHSMSTTKFDAEFYGKSAHASASPESGNNAMLSMATAILNLHAIPRCSQGDTRINVGKATAGTGRNIICDHAHIELEVRGSSIEANEYMKNYAERIIHSAAQMHGCTYKLKQMGSAISGKNDEPLMKRLANVCEKEMHLKILHLSSADVGGSEDYYYMSQRVQSHGGQSCYFLNLNPCAAPLHNDKFDFHEDALANGVKAFCGIVLDLLQ